MLLSVQVRSEVWRFRAKKRSHRVTGYNLFLNGKAGNKEGRFSIAAGEKSFLKTGAKAGDRIKGTVRRKLDPELEYADFYRAASIRILEPGEESPSVVKKPAPFTGVPRCKRELDLRGARILDEELWKGKCFSCVFATMANVHTTIGFNSFGSAVVKNGFEPFCYGPFECPLYSMGMPRRILSATGRATDSGYLDWVSTKYRPEDLD